MINRGALLLRYKVPAVKWINSCEAEPVEQEIQLDSINEERTVYLIPDKAAADDDAVRSWITLNHLALLQNELAGWIEDESLWPKNLDISLFDEWFDVECHSFVLDTSDEAIEEEDYDEILR